MYRPTIGIPTQTLHAIDGIPPALPPSWVMNQRYYQVVAAAGGVPWMVPLLARDRETLRLIYERLDGIMLAGGVDVDPTCFGAAPHPALGNVDPDRDAVELELVRWALDDDKPLLGLCRGLQVINLALGGTLHQDLAAECPRAIKHDYLPTQGWERDHLAHPVQVEPGSRLAALLPASQLLVNSMHHQGIKRLGDNLIAAAHAPDGLIEAIEAPGPGFVLGVQWHPESLEQRVPNTRRLFQAFVAAAEAWKLAPKPQAPKPQAPRPQPYPGTRFAPVTGPHDGQ
jgi:putative glutamine amidotransferase